MRAMDPVRLNSWPFNSDSKTQRKDITDASSSLTLVAGGYFITLDSSSSQGATLKIGGTAVEPATGAAEIAGFHLPPGVPMTLQIRGDETALHAIMNASSATGTLWLTRVR